MILQLLALLQVSAAPGAALAPRVYVANQDDATVSVIDVATSTLVATVDFQQLGFSATARPHHTQVEPDGAFWYVTLIGAGRVLKLDRENRIVGSVSTEVPGLMALDPGADRMVVARSMSAVNPPARVVVIRRSDMTVIDEHDSFFPRPHALVMHPKGRHAYVGSLGVNQLASLDLEDGSLQLVDVAGPYHTLTAFSVSPDGRWLLATGETSNQLLVFDLVDPAKPRFVQGVPMEAGPFESIFSWDGRRVFVTNLRANAVTVLDPDGWRVNAVVRDSSFMQPHGLALSPDGRFVYVSSRHQSGGAHDHAGMNATATGTLTVLCIPTGVREKVVAVGNYAAGISTPHPAVLPRTPTGCD